MSISKEIKKQALDLFKRGATCTSVARLLGVSVSSAEVWLMLYKHGQIDRITEKMKGSKALASAAVDRYFETGSYSQAARDFGVRPCDVHRYVKNVLNSKEPIRTRGRKSPPTIMLGDLEMPDQTQKPRTLASLEKEVHDLQIIIDSLLDSMEKNLEGSKKKYLIQQLRLLHQKGLLVKGLVKHSGWQGAHTTTERLNLLVQECKKTLKWPNE